MKNFNVSTNIIREKDTYKKIRIHYKRERYSYRLYCN